MEGNDRRTPKDTVGRQNEKVELLYMLKKSHASLIIYFILYLSLGVCNYILIAVINIPLHKSHVSL